MKLALIADIHANLEAFNAVLKEIKKRKIKKLNNFLHILIL